MDHGNWISPEVGASGASVIQVESSRLVPILAILASLCGLSIGLAIFAFSASRNADREARMLEYYLLELDAKFIHAGLKDPAESIAARLKQQREVEK